MSVRLALPNSELKGPVGSCHRSSSTVETPAAAPAQHDVFALHCCTLPASLAFRPSFVCSRRVISSWMSCISFSMSTTLSALPCNHSWRLLRDFLGVHDGSGPRLYSGASRPVLCAHGACLANFVSLGPFVASSLPLVREFLLLLIQTFSLFLQPRHCFFSDVVSLSRISDLSMCFFFRTVLLSISGAISIKTGCSQSASAFSALRPAACLIRSWCFLLPLLLRTQLPAVQSICASMSFCLLSRSAAIRHCKAAVSMLSSLDDDSYRTICCSFAARSAHLSCPARTVKHSLSPLMTKALSKIVCTSLPNTKPSFFCAVQPSCTT